MVTTSCSLGQQRDWNELCQRMSNPTQQSLVKLKRLARYLKRERQWRHWFKYGKTVEDVTTFWGLGLGRLQGDSEVIKRWCGDAW